MKKLITIVMLMILSSLAYSKPDNRARFEQEIKVGINDDVSLFVAALEEWRNDAETMSVRETDVGTTIKTSIDWLQLKAYYREVQSKQTDGRWIRENRPTVGTKLNLPSYDINQDLKIKFSDDFRIEYREFDGLKDFFRLRNKVQAELLGMYLAEEIYYNDLSEEFDTNKWIAGYKLDVSSSFSGEVYYYLEQNKKNDDWVNGSNNYGLKLAYKM